MPMAGLTIRRGETFHHDGAGGGGYGDPFTRDPALVLEDVLDEKLSLVAARRDYGVAIDPLSLSINHAETAHLRANPPAAAS